jgi:flagellar protein FlaG
MHNTDMAEKPTTGIVQEQPQPDKVRVVRAEDYREDYANSVQVNVSVWDFFLQFGRLTVGTGSEVTFSSFVGVYMSPQQAKALHLVLAQNVAQYESAFGKIRIENPNPVPGDQRTLVQ